MKVLGIIGGLASLIVVTGGGFWWAAAADGKMSQAELERTELRQGTIEVNRAVEALTSIHQQQRTEEEMQARLCAAKDATKEKCRIWEQSYGE